MKPWLVCFIDWASEMAWWLLLLLFVCAGLLALMQVLGIATWGG